MLEVPCVEKQVTVPRKAEKVTSINMKQPPAPPSRFGFNMPGANAVAECDDRGHGR